MARKGKERLNEYDLHVYARSDNRAGWYAVLTWYENQQAIATITAADHGLLRLVETVNRAMFRVQSEFAAGQLVLPESGDYAIQYFGTIRDQGTIDDDGA